MPFSLNRQQVDDLVHIPGVRAVHRVPMPTPRGVVLNTLTRAAHSSRRLQDLAPLMLRLEFG